MKFFMKIISIVLFLPFILYFFIGILLLIIGESIELMVFLVTSLLLFINGYGLYRNEKMEFYWSNIHYNFYNMVFYNGGF